MIALYKRDGIKMQKFVHILLKKCLTFALRDGKIFLYKEDRGTVLYKEILVSGVFLGTFLLL